ncbi:ATP-grasp fold amidoligase family protein [Metabacillus arenae]|uniref:Glycosyl transferase n=1 Tax=Metabacillus arenae TaxID=2771434 RepID=A0A926NNF6_9BACI|nr:ATP-grasp fold amidoligase family protein [Metabacillus arenae]MBD1383138.1 hypothetical protein [Metabacillus arenae]
MGNKIHSLKKRFKRIHGFELNLTNPRTFTEKMQWIKLNGNLERFSKYVDKYEVRQSIKEKIGEKHLVPLIGIYENVYDIKFESLPKSFVMKATHGCGWNIIVKDKSLIDWNKAREKMNRWVNSNYYDKTKEPNYKSLKGRVIIEELLQDPSGDLKDFRFFCFHGNPKYIQVDGDRFNNHKRDLYNLNWNKLPYKVVYPNFPKTLDKPKRLNAMISIARQLAQGFPFVRVDLYYLNNHIYFGELTFVPSNGFNRYPIEYDRLLGNLLDLNRYV